MTKETAIDLFQEIRNGRGTSDLLDMLPQAGFPLGEVVQTVRRADDGRFSLGVEYGILTRLMLAFALTNKDVDELL